MEKNKGKATKEELEKQLNDALAEIKHIKAEIRKAKKKTADLETQINFLEYLDDPENSEKRAQLSPQWRKIADVFFAIHTKPKK